MASSSFWIKARPCPPKCDRNDLMHAISTTFGGVIQLESKGIMVILWFSLRYKNLYEEASLLCQMRVKCHGFLLNMRNCQDFICCGCIRYEIKECSFTLMGVKILPEDDFPYSLALKAKFNFLGKVNMS